MNTDMVDASEFDGLEKALLSIVGAAGIGMLPPQVQTGDSNPGDMRYEMARVMSTASRKTNLVVSVAGLVSLGSQYFGLDIDPTWGNFVTEISPYLATDTFVREGWKWLSSNFTPNGGGNVDQTSPWGSPTLSVIYDRVKRFEHKYDTKKRV